MVFTLFKAWAVLRAVDLICSLSYDTIASGMYIVLSLCRLILLGPNLKAGLGAGQAGEACSQSGGWSL